MASKRVFAMAFAENDIDEDEFICLMRISKTQGDRVDRQIFDLNSFTAEECKKNFRFAQPEVELLCEALQFPEHLMADNGCRMTGLDSLCLLLRRLAYPSRLHDLELMFGKDLSVLSRFFNLALEHVHSTFSHVLSSLDQSWMDETELTKWALAVERKGAPFNRCVAFIDGTNIEICRPSGYTNQKVCYSGYTREYDLNCSGVMAACGIFIHVYGPVPGSYHDGRMLYESKLQEQMAGSLVWTPMLQTAFYLYGDQAYKSTPHLMSPFRAPVSDVENLCNKTMSSLRISVEWGFGKVSQLFAFTEFAENQKLFLQPVEIYYRVAIILTNCHTCLYGSIVSDYFEVEPPSLANYLRSEH